MRFSAALLSDRDARRDPTICRRSCSSRKSTRSWRALQWNLEEFVRRSESFAKEKEKVVSAKFDSILVWTFLSTSERGWRSLITRSALNCTKVFVGELRSSVEVSLVEPRTRNNIVKQRTKSSIIRTTKLPKRRIGNIFSSKRRNSFLSFDRKRSFTEGEPKNFCYLNEKEQNSIWREKENRFSRSTLDKSEEERETNPPDAIVFSSFLCWLGGKHRFSARDERTTFLFNFQLGKGTSAKLSVRSFEQIRSEVLTMKQRVENKIVRETSRMWILVSRLSRINLELRQSNDENEIGGCLLDWILIRFFSLLLFFFFPFVVATRSTRRMQREKEKMGDSSILLQICLSNRRTKFSASKNPNETKKKVFNWVSTREKTMLFRSLLTVLPRLVVKQRETLLRAVTATRWNPMPKSRIRWIDTNLIKIRSSRERTSFADQILEFNSNFHFLFV